jgi:hypothetical protein
VFGIVLNDDVPFDAQGAMKRLMDLGVGSRPFFWPMHRAARFPGAWDFSPVKIPEARTHCAPGFYLPSGLALNPKIKWFASLTRSKGFSLECICSFSRYYDLLYRDKDYSGRGAVRCRADEEARSRCKVGDRDWLRHRRVTRAELPRSAFVCMEVDRSAGNARSSRRQVGYSGAGDTSTRMRFTQGDARSVRLREKCRSRDLALSRHELSSFE